MVFCFLSPLKAETVPAADFLMPDGTINAATVGNQHLTLDITGWHVELDPTRGPVFSPAPPPLADTWSALDQGLNSAVSVIAVIGSDIYVGGQFTNVGGGTSVTGLNYIAKWNGSTWSALDQGLNGDVYAIAVIGSDIYVGGLFTDVGTGGTSVPGLNYIAKWNGSAWSALGEGLSNIVFAIAVSGSNLYVGGSFTAVGGGTPVTGLNAIAKWNGSAWSALDQGLSSSDFAYVKAIVVIGSDVYVGGTFEQVGGGTPVPGLNNIAKWSGSAWSALGQGLNSAVNAIAVSGSDIYVGGFFTDVGGGTSVTGLKNIAGWNVTVVLPVELLDFTATPSVSSNLLTWTTASEINNKGFQVERLMANGEWRILGFVAAKSKAATYEFLDNDPLSISTYRLRQIDNDGKETLSKVISVERKSNGKLKAYPNPVSNVLTVEYTEGGDYQILNLLGQKVMNGKKPSSGTGGLDVSALPVGTYVLKVGTEQVKFVKQ